MAWSKLAPDLRGYGPAWRKKRARILKRDGYVCRCSGCKASGRILEATEVDHVVSKAAWLREHGNLRDVDDDTNLQAINVDCHKLKTILERGARPRQGCTPNGWPTDPDHHWNRS